MTRIKLSRTETGAIETEYVDNGARRPTAAERAAQIRAAAEKARASRRAADAGRPVDDTNDPDADLDAAVEVVAGLLGIKPEEVRRRLHTAEPEVEPDIATASEPEAEPEVETQPEPEAETEPRLKRDAKPSTRHQCPICPEFSAASAGGLAAHTRAKHPTGG